jgi:single-strand DNA-binding protein
MDLNRKEVSLNQIEMTGVLDKPAEMHNGPNGPIANLTIVSSHQRPAEAGGVETASQYYRIAVFKPEAVKFVQEELKPGDPVRIRGKIQNQPYKDGKGIDQVGLQIQVAGPQSMLEKTPSRAADQADFNRVRLMGRLGGDPVVTDGQDGQFVFLRVATKEAWRDRKTNDPKEDTQWHSIAIFNPKLAEAASKLKKGDPVNIEGVLRHTARTDDQGNKRSGPQIQLGGPDAKLRLMPVEHKQGMGGRSR